MKPESITFFGSPISTPRAVPASGFALVAIAAALWGTDVLFRRGLALDIPAASVVFWEHVILTIITIPILVRVAPIVRSLSRRDLVAILIVGAGASAAATILFTASFTYGDPTTPLLLQKLQPLIVVGGAYLLLRERITPRYPIYFLVAVAGAYLMTFPDPFQISATALKPALLAVSAAALWGLGTVLGRGLSAKVPFAQLTALRFAIGLPTAAIILFIQHGTAGYGMATLTHAPALLLLSIVPGLLALLLYYRGLQRTPSTAATLAELAFPITALLIGYLVFDVSLAPSQLFGLAVVAATISAMGLAARKGSEAIGIQVRVPPEAHDSDDVFGYSRP
jgi:drug/metabolite transporter (DMT)-like permease